MRKFVTPVLVGIISFLAGIYACIIFKKFSQFNINPSVGFEINPFEIFSLITAIVLATYVARTLSKKSDLEKAEKDLLIDYLTDFKGEFNNRISYILEQEAFDKVETNSKFKILRKRIDTIIALANEHKFIVANDEHSNDLKSKIRDIWELSTDTPKKPTGRTSTAVRADIDRLRLEQVNKIEMAVIEVDKLIFQLTMKINRK